MIVQGTKAKKKTKNKQTSKDQEKKLNSLDLIWNVFIMNYYEATLFLICMII